MSLDYTLIIEDKMNVSDIKKLLLSSTSQKGNDGIAKVSNFDINISTTTGLLVEVIRDEFNFHPEITISFRLDKFADSQILYKQLFQVFWLILKETKGDAVVLFNGQTIVLHRKKGILYLNNINDFWNKDKLPTNQLYEFQTIEGI